MTSEGLVLHTGKPRPSLPVAPGLPFSWRPHCLFGSLPLSRRAALRPARHALDQQCHSDRHRGVRSVATTRRGLKIPGDYEPMRPIAVRPGQTLRHEHAHVGERRQRHHVRNDERSR